MSRRTRVVRLPGDGAARRRGIVLGLFRRGPAPPGPRARPWRALRAQLAAELRLTLRRGESMLAAVVLPAALLVVLSHVPGMDGEGGTVLPGILAIALVATSMVSLGIATGYERHYGVLKRLGATPLGRLSLLGAKAGGVLTLEVAQVVMLGLVAALFAGWGPSVHPGGLALALVLGTSAFAGIGFLLAGTLRAEANLAATNGLFLLLMLGGGTIVPAGRLPAALAVVARVLPADALTQTFAWGTGGPVPPPVALLTLAAWAVGAPLLASRLFSWE